MTFTRVYGNAIHTRRCVSALMPVSPTRGAYVILSLMGAQPYYKIQNTKPQVEDVACYSRAPCWSHAAQTLLRGSVMNLALGVAALFIIDGFGFSASAIFVLNSSQVFSGSLFYPRGDFPPCFQDNRCIVLLLLSLIASGSRENRRRAIYKSDYILLSSLGCLDGRLRFGFMVQFPSFYACFLSYLAFLSCRSLSIHLSFFITCGTNFFSSQYIENIENNYLKFKTIFF